MKNRFTANIIKIRIIIAAMMLISATLLLSGCGSAAAKAEEKAEAYIAAGDYSKAAEELTNVISKADTDSADDVELLINAYYIRGDCYKKLGNTDSAATDYRTALSEDLKDRGFAVEVTAVRYLRRGLVYVSSEDWQNALESFKGGLACQEVSCGKELLRNEIVCYEKLNDYDTARTLLSEYVSKYPEDSEMLTEYDFLQTRKSAE